MIARNKHFPSDPSDVLFLGLFCDPRDHMQQIDPSVRVVTVIVVTVTVVTVTVLIVTVVTVHEFYLYPSSDCLPHSLHYVLNPAKQ